MLARLTEGKAPLTLEANCKTTEKYWGKGSGEGVLIVHRGELVTGTMDKAQYGKFGLVHGVQVSFMGSNRSVSRSSFLGAINRP